MFSNTLIRNRARTSDLTINYIVVSAVAFNWLVRRKKTRKNVEVFAASLADIQKALTVRSKTDSRTKLPKRYHKFLAVFDTDAAEKLSPVRDSGVNHTIEIEKKNGQK